MTNKTNIPTAEFLVHIAICHYRNRVTSRLLECIAARAIGGAL